MFCFKAPLNIILALALGCLSVLTFASIFTFSRLAAYHLSGFEAEGRYSAQNIKRAILPHLYRDQFNAGYELPVDHQSEARWKTWLPLALYRYATVEYEIHNGPQQLEIRLSDMRPDYCPSIMGIMVSGEEYAPPGFDYLLRVPEVRKDFSPLSEVSRITINGKQMPALPADRDFNTNRFAATCAEGAGANALSFATITYARSLSPTPRLLKMAEEYDAMARWRIDQQARLTPDQK